MLSMVSGVAITRLTLTKINRAEIPLPPLRVQQEIATDIQTEQALVSANRDLIARFELKNPSRYRTSLARAQRS